MTRSSGEMTVYEPGSRPELFEHPAIFLSASVPYLREPEDVQPGFTVEDNRWLVASAKPQRIREAISHLCRFAFRRNVDLVFGGHPAITPMVLESARRFGGEERKRVVVFQSLFFQEKIPRETFELARWELGTPLWTAPRENDRWQSLTWMREAMIASPNLISAIFIGGMEGLFEEAEIFRREKATRPCFAVGSTGGAAAELLACDGFYQEAAGLDTLGETLSYPLVMRRIFHDLEPF
ncbi:MAG: hypothetical protein GY835_18630 [bacterium]|nr:hypothetical protein [bacterium]